MASNSASPVIVWFRDDLRLSDHPALHAAAGTRRLVICLYVFDETSQANTPAPRPLGGAARWWLAQSLRALQKSGKLFRLLRHSIRDGSSRPAFQQSFCSAQR